MCICIYIHTHLGIYLSPLSVLISCSALFSSCLVLFCSLSLSLRVFSCLLVLCFPLSCSIFFVTCESVWLAGSFSLSLSLSLPLPSLTLPSPLPKHQVTVLEEAVRRLQSGEADLSQKGSVSLHFLVPQAFADEIFGRHMADKWSVEVARLSGFITRRYMLRQMTMPVNCPWSRCSPMLQIQMELLPHSQTLLWTRMMALTVLTQLKRRQQSPQTRHTPLPRT